MAIPLFWRLILGYAAILLISIGSSIYSIVQLGTLSQTARATIDTDYRMITEQENLTDALLSEFRYGGKYLITRSPMQHEQFDQFTRDFLRYLGIIKSSATSEDITTQLLRIEQSHLRYHGLFEQEVAYLTGGQPYAQSRYQQERDKILESSLSDLDRLKSLLQNHVHEKLGHMENAARTSRTIAIATSVVLLIMGTALSVRVSASIANPLRELKRKTQEKAFESDTILERSPIIEIQELYRALVQKEQNLRAAAQADTRLVERVTEELASQLISFKKKLKDLNAESQSTGASVNASSVDTLIRETDQLVQHCAELNASAAAKWEFSNLPVKLNSSATSDFVALGKVNGKTEIACDAPIVFARQKDHRIPEWCGNLVAHLLRRIRLHKTSANEQNG